MQIADPRQMTSTKRKLILRDVAGMGPALPLDVLNGLALKYQLPQIEVRGLLVASGYKIPEVVVHQRTDQEPIKKPAPEKPKVAPEIVAGILKGAIYKQLGEGDDAYVITTRAAFLREREAIRAMMKGAGIT
jgi:hypothetical protein